MNPLMTLYDQISETVYAHEPKAAREQVDEKVRRALLRASSRALTLLAPPVEETARDNKARTMTTTKAIIVIVTIKAKPAGRLGIWKVGPIMERTGWESNGVALVGGNKSPGNGGSPIITKYIPNRVDCASPGFVLQ